MASTNKRVPFSSDDLQSSPSFARICTGSRRLVYRRARNLYTGVSLLESFGVVYTTKIIGRAPARSESSASNQARAPSRLNALNFSWKKNTNYLPSTTHPLHPRPRADARLRFSSSLPGRGSRTVPHFLSIAMLFYPLLPVGSLVASLSKRTQFQNHL